VPLILGVFIELSYIHSMPQSLSYLLVHVIFSTKERAPFLNSSVRMSLHAYLATITRDRDCECYRVGGVADQVHLAIRLSRTMTTAKLVERLKTVSSKWIKAQFPDLAGFAWQSGYGAFSVGPSDLGALIQYIDAQEEHHQRRSFQEEYRAFLEKYGVPYDERYVWD
jgi:putative transposase